jgi:outer membrane protein TolC
MRESRAALLDVIQVSRTRYETGLALQQDLLLAEVERSQLEGEILHTQALARAARAELNLLAGRAAHEPLGRPWLDGPSPFTATVDELMTAARAQRPRLRALQRQIDAADAARRAADIAARPDFIAGAGYVQLPGEPDMWRAELGVTLPFWKGRKQDAAAGEAARRAAAARAQAEAEANAVAIQVQEQFAHVSSEREIVGLYRREILPMAQLAYASARASYLTGQGSFVLVLEAFRKRMELRRAYYEYLADSEMHLAQLESAVGQDLGAVHIAIDAALTAAPGQKDTP